MESENDFPLLHVYPQQNARTRHQIPPGLSSTAKGVVDAHHPDCPNV